MVNLTENRKFYASRKQREILLHLLTHPVIEQNFFLTGGTALAVFYLQHRLSDDLDFFTLDSVLLPDIDFWIRRTWPEKSQKTNEGPDFLSFLVHDVKLDFIIDPLSNRARRDRYTFENNHHLSVDNLDNVVSNKLTTLVSRNEPKDYVDFYFILTTYTSLSFNTVYEQACSKDALFEDPPTVAFRIEEGLAFLRSNPPLMPAIHKDFNRSNFFHFYKDLIDNIYRKLTLNQ